VARDVEEGRGLDGAVLADDPDHTGALGDEQSRIVGRRGHVRRLAEARDGLELGSGHGGRRAEDGERQQRERSAEA
jgi:hypothetical protein